MGRRRVDLQTAAQLLGISSDAVRKRAKRGNIDYETGADGKLYVWVDTGQTTDYPTSNVGPGGLHGDVSHAHDPREELIATLREQLEAEREANREMRRLLAGLIERVPQLEAPAESPTESREPSESAGESPDTAEPRSTTEEQQEPTSQPQEKRSWWRRMFGS
jgi:hypothetical protein